MRHLATITTHVLLMAYVISGYSQSMFENPNDVISGFYSALEERDDSARQAQFDALFHPNGTVHTVVQRSSMQSSVNTGSYKKFLQESKNYYSAHGMTYDEVERSIDYYVDVAMVHSLVFQSIIEDKRPETVYELMLWFSFSMAYENDRWYLTSVSWINAFEDEDIDDAMELDTLWHRIEK